MAAFHILCRSQSYRLLNSPKFNLILPSLNPNFSRHFHSDDSITPKSSPESPPIDIDRVSEHNSSPEKPISESTPRVCSINPVTSDSKVGKDVVKSFLPFSASENEGGKFNRSVNESEVSDKVIKSSWLPDQSVGQNEPVSLDDVNPEINHFDQRIRLPGLVGEEVNTVLGGGVVLGSMIFVGGNPGVGKSTLALQMAALIAESCDVGGSGPVSYTCGEESVEQIRNRADRLSINMKDLFLYRSTDVEDVLEKMRLLSPRAVVVDSIHTMYLKGVTGNCGGLAQLKACTFKLVDFAKQTNIPVISTGHVNKSGVLAGPRTLDHIVDTVLYLDGEKHSSRRILRSEKNRFGSTDELGVFEMSNSGLKAVSNPSEMFLREEHSDSEHFIGHAITVIFRGPQTLLVKVQALCVPELGASTDVNGVQLSRARFIASVLRQQARLELEHHSISLNIINGVFLKETSGDLAVAAAICSSFMELPLPNDMAFIGEIGLGGELITVPKIEKSVNTLANTLAKLEKSVNTLAKLGYKTCVIPESAVKALEGLSSKIQIIGCKNLKQVIDKVFKRLEWLQPCSVSPVTHCSLL